MLHELVAALRFTVIFVIMPIFAFANAGVPLAGIGLDSFPPARDDGNRTWPSGRQADRHHTLAVVLAVKSGLAETPRGSSWTQIVGIGFLAGIGFTMSLFIGGLAFADDSLMNPVRSVYSPVRFLQHWRALRSWSRRIVVHRASAACTR